MKEDKGWVEITHLAQELFNESFRVDNPDTRSLLIQASDRIIKLESLQYLMLEALEAAEWGSHSYKQCPVCGELGSLPHLPDCLLANAIKKAKE